MRTELDVDIQPRPCLESQRAVYARTYPCCIARKTIGGTVADTTVVFGAPVILIGREVIVVGSLVILVVDEVAFIITLHLIGFAFNLIGRLVEEVRTKPRLLTEVGIRQTLVHLAVERTSYTPTIR